MTFFLQCVRFAGVFFLLTPALFLLRLSVWPVALYSERLDRRLKNYVMRHWYRNVLRILGVKVVVKGTPPKPPFYLVANHLSYIDMLVLAQETDCLFVSKGDVEHWPVIGFMVKSLYILFIDRQNKRDTARVNKLLAHAMEAGECFAIFAESRISCGHDVMPFKSALIQPALDNHVPVYWAALHYQSPPNAPSANKVVVWWRPEAFFPHIFRLMKHPGVTATVTFGSEPVYGEDRKVVAEQLFQAVRGAFIPVD